MARRARPGEFALIERYFRPLARDAGAFGSTDDAALYRQRPGDDLVLTVDTVSAGVHFFPDDPPEAIARKALRVNLSDLAAKGATPFGYLMSLALPADWTEAWLARFAKGLAADQKAYRRLAPRRRYHPRARRAHHRDHRARPRAARARSCCASGAKPGDVVFVTGTIGDAALGLRLRQARRNRRSRRRNTCCQRSLVPEPRVALVPAIRRYASASVDVSDGLVGDLGHICAVSGVGADIDRGLCAAVGCPRGRCSPPTRRFLSTILNGGDDYEMVACVPAGFRRRVPARRGKGRGCRRCHRRHNRAQRAAGGPCRGWFGCRALGREPHAFLRPRPSDHPAPPICSRSIPNDRRTCSKCH